MLARGPCRAALAVAPKDIKTTHSSGLEQIHHPVQTGQFAQARRHALNFQNTALLSQCPAQTQQHGQRRGIKVNHPRCVQHHRRRQVRGQLRHPLRQTRIGLVVKHLKKGNKVRVTGLGIFQVRARPARMGRNPATGEAIKIKASKKVAFRVAKDLKEAI